MLNGRKFAGKRLPLTVAFAVLLVAAFGAGCKGFFQPNALESVAIQPASLNLQVNWYNDSFPPGELIRTTLARKLPAEWSGQQRFSATQRSSAGGTATGVSVTECCCDYQWICSGS